MNLVMASTVSKSCLVCVLRPSVALRKCSNLAQDVVRWISGTLAPSDEMRVISANQSDYLFVTSRLGLK